MELDSQFTSHFLGITSVLIFTLTPALPWILYGKRSLLERMGKVIGINMAIHAFLLTVLALLKCLTRPVAIGYGLASVGVSFLLVLKLRSKLHRKFDQQKFDPQLTILAGGWVLLILAVLFFKGFTQPFLSWDAVASWNMIARNITIDPKWFGHYPFFYTQHTSITMAFPYFWSGNRSLEYYSHGLFFFHILLLYAVTLEFSRRMRSPFAPCFALLFVIYPVSAFAGGGYSDMASSAYALWAVLLVAKAARAQNRGARDLMVVGAGFMAATSYLFKQSGLVFLGLVGLLFVIPKLKKLWGHVMVFLLIASVPVLTWHLLSVPEPNQNQLVGVLTNFDQGRSIGKALKAAWLAIGKETTIFSPLFFDQFVFIGMIGACLVSFFRGGVRKRFRSLMVLSSFLFLLVWAVTANYDLRAAMPALVSLSFVIGAGVFRGLSPRVVQASTATFAIMFCLGQVFNDYPYKNFFDYQPGVNWLRVNPLAGIPVKRAKTYSSLFELEEWKKYVFTDPTYLVHRVWSDGVTRTGLDPDRIDGGGLWLSSVEKTPGTYLWNKDDWVFIGSHMANFDRNKDEYVMQNLGSKGKSKQTWLEWAEELAEKGLLRREQRYGNSPIYRVL